MENRKLIDLRSVGPAIVRDFHALGTRSVEELAKCDGDDLYEKLCNLKGTYVDVCVLDVFNCAIAQAQDPDLPADLRDWWTWSRIRKGELDPPRSG